MAPRQKKPATPKGSGFAQRGTCHQRWARGAGLTGALVGGGLTTEDRMDRIALAHAHRDARDQESCKQQERPANPFAGIWFPARLALAGAGALLRGCREAVARR